MLSMECVECFDLLQIRPHEIYNLGAQSNVKVCVCVRVHLCVCVRGWIICVSERIHTCCRGGETICGFGYVQ